MFYVYVLHLYIMFFNAIHMYIKLYSSGPCNYISIYIYIDCIYIYIYMLQDGPPQLYVGLKTIINPINYS